MCSMEHVFIDIIKEECFARFTLSFHARCAQMHRANQNQILPLLRTVSEVASWIFFSFMTSFAWTLEP